MYFTDDLLIPPYKSMKKYRFKQRKIQKLISNLHNKKYAFHYRIFENNRIAGKIIERLKKGVDVKFLNNATHL